MRKIFPSTFSFWYQGSKSKDDSDHLVCFEPNPSFVLGMCTFIICISSWSNMSPAWNTLNSHCGEYYLFTLFHSVPSLSLVSPLVVSSPVCSHLSVLPHRHLRFPLSIVSHSPVSPLHLLPLLLLPLFSVSVEPLWVHRHTDCRLCRGGGMLFRHSTRRYCTTFTLPHFFIKFHSHPAVLWPLLLHVTQHLMKSKVKKRNMSLLL